MTTYKVIVTRTDTFCITVEADSEEEAESKARDNDFGASNVENTEQGDWVIQEVLAR